MRYRTLGRTGLKVSEIGIGGIGAMGKYGTMSPEEFSVTMARATQRGVNFLDTAPAYGDSESVFGYHLKNHRKDWIVCTKIGTCGSWGSGELLTREEIFRQVEQSLSRLRIEHIDLLLIHSIDQFGEGATAADRVLNHSDMLDAMKKLQAHGKVRFIGTSGHLPELVPAASSGAFDVVLTYNTYNLLVQEAHEQLFPLAQKLELGVILAGAFYQGLITNPDFVLQKKEIWFEKADPGFFDTEGLMRKRAALLEYAGGDIGRLAQLAVRFALSHPTVSTVVSGVRFPEEVEQNAAASDRGALSEDEIARLVGRNCSVSMSK